MVGPAAKRIALSHVKEVLKLSERRICRVVGLNRSTASYTRQPSDDAEVKNKLVKLAELRPRYGQQRLHVLLRREGMMINHKRTERLYRELHLSLRLKKRRRKKSVARVVYLPAQRPQQYWSVDFVHDQIADGRRIKCLTLVDDFSRQCLAIEVARSLRSIHVVDVLERLKFNGLLPSMITLDNGPEFIAKTLDEWTFKNNVKLNFIQPGKPTQNAIIESFNGKFRDECLNQELFFDTNDAKQKIERWRHDYNHNRPHSSLNNKTPSEYLKDWEAMVSA